MTAPAVLSKRPSVRHQRWPILLAVGVSVAVFGVLLSIASARAHHSSPGSASSGISSASLGSPLIVHDVDGASVVIPGGQPTVLFFFTGECSACYIGAQNLGVVLKQIGSGASVVAVELDPSEPTDVINQFLTAVGDPPFSVVRDDGSLLRHFNVNSLGTTVVLNASGKEVFRAVDPEPARIREALVTAGFVFAPGATP